MCIRDRTYRRILIFIVILGVLMGLLGKKFAGDQYVNTEPRKNTECTLTKRVFDDADVLTDEEEKNLEALIAEKEELIGGDLVLITTNDASLDTMEKLRDYAQNYYKDVYKRQSIQRLDYTLQDYPSFIRLREKE